MRQVINIGARPRDGTGDTVRAAFDKANQNFTELYGASTAFLLPAVTSAQLPAPAAVGMIACVTDATSKTPGVALVGGGGFSVLAFFNGTIWIVVGG